MPHAKSSRKGRNPGVVDNWLDSIGLYRKNVAYDETCLFRAVSEQLFDCQIFHERVRRECVEYGRKHYYEFWDLLDDEDEWYEHMRLLEKHMVVCGNIEIQIVSRKYNRDVLVFDAAHQQLHNVTQRNLDKVIMLCLMNEDHYDVVHKREHIQNAGFCQSLVYNILYENVFKVENVQEIVHGMLYEKEFVTAPFSETNNNKDSAGQSANIAPFPFKVAKALDPTIYRNIEYDSWTEVRREMRLGDWYYGDDNLILGTKCILNLDDETYECYIQEIVKDENKCVVYVVKLAEKRLVNYSDLSPENDAKPWPLPYRFSKNLVVSSQTAQEKSLKLPKKRKDKRRNKSNSESSAQSHSITLQETETDVKAFVGIPLQMQSPITPEPAPHFTASTPQECPQEMPSVSLSQHNLLVTPDVPSPMPKFSWEAPWNGYVSTPDQVMWPHTPTTPNTFNYPMRPVIASAPVTPDVIPYHGFCYFPDLQYPYMYNYHVDHYNNPMNSWGPPEEYPTPPQESANDSQECEVTHQSESNQYSPYTPETTTYEQQAPSPRERLTLCTSIAQQSPQMEMFSPVIPIPPGTPVIYAHTPEVAEVLMPAPHMQMYVPQADVQYMSPRPFLYPTTPPATWYTPGINAQGFIFPSPINHK